MLNLPRLKDHLLAYCGSLEMEGVSSGAELQSSDPCHLTVVQNDETHFWLNGYVNKQNCRIWSEANPQVYVETPLHPEKLTVWGAL
ncbi:hypothetical protein TNCV_1800231 [Trichonephila clavipes]|nr:hypothetical protein TNCV_1800231 [Trichonephila clavipes]